ncbi:hypothetical protein VST7929_03045 [Vibrio stylophorae]|uniref:Tyr recombinase domain-containing protein n=1 Tax=Vibrio stylophorae TaxID=659351 RepID=A0ABM8ZXL9_9VIBR|nr:tyrosine-type recombinase/integrase [Vibrio stylophorae]CAH0535471.1 hypothetical protein VST7929_03045 [Vibrio stylophorae]
MAKQVQITTDSPALFALFTRPLEDLAPLQTLTQGEYAKNSLLAMRKDWNHFVEYCQLNSRCPLPAEPNTVKLFLLQMSQARKFASLRRYSLTIARVHRYLGQIDPVAHREVHYTLQSLRGDKKDDATQARPFHAKHLKALYRQLGESELVKDQRDLAIWAVMFETLLKRSELCELTCANLAEDDDGTLFIEIDQHYLPLTQETRAQLEYWLALAGISDGLLFRSIDRHSNVAQSPMDHSSIYRVFRRASQLLGFDHKNPFSGQSSRVGATQALAKTGLNLDQIQKIGRWKSAAMPAQYLGKKVKSEREKAKFKRQKDLN